MNHPNRNAYESMSDDELQNSLRYTAFTDQALDMEQIDAILTELDRRGLQQPALSEADAWQEFQKEYAESQPFFFEETDAVKCAQSQKKKPGFRQVRIALIAAAITIASFFAVQAAGVDVFGAMARWTSEIFSFGTIASNDAAQTKRPEVDLDPNRTFNSLQEALDAYGVTEVRAPTWVPDDYTLSYVEVSPNDVWLSFHAVYYDDADGAILVSFHANDGSHFAYYEKTEKEPETLQWNGQTYYLIENSRNYTIVWRTANYECSISGTVAMDVLLEILYSQE